MKKINFFIIGAPKCGTTSLAAYLGQHKDICFSEPKEPHYFFDNDNFGYSGSLNSFINSCFAHCDEKKIWGEGSVWYLYSHSALIKIKKHNPEAKVIIMLRNPVDMVYSLFYQKRHSLEEDEKDFESAWNLYESRKMGENIPKQCTEYRFILYKDIVKYYKYVKNVYHIFPAKNILVIDFDKFKDSTKIIYQRTLEFLNIPDDDRNKFEIINPNKEYRSRIIRKFLKYLSNNHRQGIRRLKKIPLLKKIPFLQTLNHLNTKFTQRPAFSQESQKIILNFVKDDIILLGKFLKKDFRKWLKLK